jgi:hypothetical protein
MKLWFKIVALLWLFVAILMGMISFNGGETAVGYGLLLYFVWTAPFGIIFYYYHDSLLSFVPSEFATPLGTTLIIFLAFLFWFLLVPKLFRHFRKTDK